MTKNTYSPTSYHFDMRKWSAKFSDDEKITSSLFNDGLIIGELLRNVDKECDRLVEMSNGFSKVEILTYQQVMTVDVFMAAQSPYYNKNINSMMEAIHDSSALCMKIARGDFNEYKNIEIYHELFSLASRRLFLEHQWDKISKSNWIFKNDGHKLVLSPSAHEIDYGEKIAGKRFEDHLLQLSEKAVSDGGVKDPKIIFLPKKISSDNDAFNVVFDIPCRQDLINHQIILNQYPFYYIDFCKTPLIDYPELSILDVRYFWLVFNRLSYCIIMEFLTGGLVNLPLWFTKNQLVNILTHCIDISLNQAEQLVDLHVNSKNTSSDFYLKPIYIVDNKYYLSFGVFLGGQFTRVIDEVVKTQLKFSEFRKGRFFEQGFKKLISEQMARNKVLQSGFCQVVATSFRQRRGKQNEEIDLIIRIGETYLLIEEKSFVYRVGITGYHNNLNEMQESNAEQKIRFFIDDYERFRNIHDQCATFPIKEENILFCYLSSVPHAAGMKINGFPVVDLSILERYFDQGFFELRGKNNESKLFKFYNSAEQAEKNLKRYLNAPPQLEKFKRNFCYIYSDCSFNYQGVGVQFKEAAFNINDESEEQTFSYLWRLADIWYKDVSSDG